jgi:hypothetical protein
MRNETLKKYLNNTIITALIGIAAGLFLKMIDNPLVL